jgi:hypothetical protein
LPTLRAHRYGCGTVDEVAEFVAATTGVPLKRAKCFQRGGSDVGLKSRDIQLKIRPDDLDRTSNHGRRRPQKAGEQVLDDDQRSEQVLQFRQIPFVGSASRPDRTKPRLCLGNRLAVPPKPQRAELRPLPRRNGNESRSRRDKPGELALEYPFDKRRSKVVALTDKRSDEECPSARKPHCERGATVSPPRPTRTIQHCSAGATGRTERVGRFGTVFIMPRLLEDPTDIADGHHATVQSERVVCRR